MPVPVPALTLVSALVLCAAGCDRGAAPSAEPVETAAARGPIELRVRLDPGAVAVGERLTLTIEASAPEGIELTLPDVPDTLGPFTARRVAQPEAAGDAPDRVIYTLDTFVEGEAEIPPLTLAYVDRRPETLERLDEALEGELTTDPLAVTVSSVLTEADPRDRPMGAVRVPIDRPVSPWLWIAPVALVALVGVTLLATRLRRGGAVATRREPPPVPAHLWAKGELDRLAADGLVASGRFHEFYVRLSGIVREYIERRFGLMAPERTTEEFLRETRDADALDEGHKTLLAGFLRAADLVKFARHEPSAADAEEAFAAARGFVEQTADAAPAAEVAA